MGFAHAVARGRDRRLPPDAWTSRLTHPQYLVMLALWERSLARSRHPDALDSSGNPLTSLERLEAQGYLRRERSTHAERTLDVTLTDAGRELRTVALGIPLQVVDRLGMSLDEPRSCATSSPP